MSFSLAEAVVYFKGDDKQLDADLNDAHKKTESSAASMAKAFGGAILGGAAIAGTAILGIASSAFDVASQIDAATDQIGASLGLGADEAKAYGETIKSVYGNNFGDSIEDVGKSVEVVAKQLKLAGNDPSLKKMTENAFRLRDVFGVDVAESIDAVKTLTDSFGISSQEAFDMVAKGYEIGLDRSGDFLDTIGEYSTQFANGGADAREFFSVIETGAQGGVLGTDKAADAFKEFRVRIQDGSDLTKTSLESIGLNADEMAAKMADGSLTAMDAFNQVTSALGRLDDKSLQMQAGVGLLGTQFEDLGQSGIEAIDSMSDNFANVEGSTDKLDAKYTNLTSVVEGFWRQFQVGIAPAGEALLGLVNENLPALQGAVTMVSGAVVAAINLIPVAIAETRKKWDEDWAGIRTTWEAFAADLPKQQEEFWGEWNEAFNSGSEENKQDWESFFGGLFGGTLRWVSTILELFTTFLGNWNNTTKAWHALTIGDWSTFWASLGANFTAAFDVLLSTVDIFDKGFKERMVGAFQSAWDGLKGMWNDFATWWNSTIGSLPGMGLGIINMSGPPELNTQQTINDILGKGSLGVINPLNQGANAQMAGGINLTQHFYGPTDPRATKDASEDGVLKAARGLGLR